MSEGGQLCTHYWSGEFFIRDLCWGESGFLSGMETGEHIQGETPMSHVGVLSKDNSAGSHFSQDQRTPEGREEMWQQSSFRSQAEVQ